MRFALLKHIQHSTISADFKHLLSALADTLMIIDPEYLSENQTRLLEEN
jgi:hypothetical protein